MSYEVALNKAWDELAQLGPGKDSSVRFLSDGYKIDLDKRRVISLSCNIPAKDYAAILILHYFINRLRGLPQLSSEWISFKELEAGEIYYPAFRKRAIEPLVRKYGKNPEGIWQVLERLAAQKVKAGDVGIDLEIFPGVPALIILWRGDDEFEPEANMLFDKSIAKIFCTEDIAVLAGFVAAKV
ncbi:DUF3786 domain-containing protein [bacterium]|nr:MAG: DUF3786 domain-containing protein [bacterium]